MMIHSNLSRTELIEAALLRREVRLSEDGALVCLTGKFTGRAAKDKYVVRDSVTESTVDWGKVNTPLSPENFSKLRKKVLAALDSKDSFVKDLSVGADARFVLPLKVRTEFAYQALFAETMFREPVNEKKVLEPFSVFAAPSVVADPATDGTRTGTFIVINFTTREILVGGTQYSGEIKKSVFTVMNFLLPQRGVLSMHAAANCDDTGKSAVFFGLSGTGKTSLSADASRKLIGDDEHGWSDDGVFNIEGGCYAKAIKLSPKAEPEIWHACHSFGTILENVVMDEKTRAVDFDSAKITENTRAAYKLCEVPNFEPTGRSGHPSAVIMLACDAYGILPPIARLSKEQAMYYFLSGYTAKVAGTEAGVTEPTSTFSACFGEPFMALSPTVYAKLLGERLTKHNVPCYLINTGWWKGEYGVGERMPISMSRALVNAAVSGELVNTPTTRDATFGFEIPQQVRGVAPEHLLPQNSWKDKVAYQEKAKRLAQMFVENFKRYDGKVDDSIRNAGPLC